MRKASIDKLRARAAERLKTAKNCRLKAAYWRDRARGWEKLASDDLGYANHLDRLPDHLRIDGLHTISHTEDHTHEE